MATFSIILTPEVRTDASTGVEVPNYLADLCVPVALTEGRQRLHSASSGVVGPECGGTPFRQIFLSWNGAPVNIVYHSRNADTELSTNKNLRLYPVRLSDGPTNSDFSRSADLQCAFGVEQTTCTSVRGTAAAVPPPIRIGDPALCGSHPLVTLLYYCRTRGLYVCLFIVLLYFVLFAFSGFSLFL